MNDDDRFRAWVTRLLEAWRAEKRWRLVVQRRDSRFVRALVSEAEVSLETISCATCARWEPADEPGEAAMARHHARARAGST